MAPSAAWQERFTRRRIAAVQLGTTGRTAGLVEIAEGGDTRLHAWDLPTGALREIDAPGNRNLGPWLSQDGRYAYLLADDHGDEFGHLTAVDLHQPATPVDLTPTMDRYTLRGVHASRDGAGLALIAVDADGFHLYLLGSAGAPDPAPRRLATHTYEAWNCLLSADTTIAVWETTAQNPGQRRFAVQAVRTSDGAELGTFSDGPGTSVQAFLMSPTVGDASAIVVSDHSGWRRPVRWHIPSGQRRPLQLSDQPGDLLPLDWSGDGRHVLLCRSHRGSQQLLRYDLHTDDWQVLDAPPGSYFEEFLRATVVGPGAWFDADADGAVVVAYESLECPITVQRHLPDGSDVVLLSADPMPPGRPASSVDIPSSDGTTAQGWLVTPAGRGPFPAVIAVHGGPHDVWRDAFDPQAQAWVDHGYAYLQLNYRGSITFGTAYREAVWGDVGRPESEDIVAARAWLVGQGIAAPGRVVLTGASYGGFLTLYTLGVHPEGWAGGIAEIALADWTMAYQDANPAIRGAIKGWFGGTPEELPELYRDRSPLTHLPRLTAPVLIRQGRYDSRTPARQMEVYEQRAREWGRPVTVRWDEAGHAGVEQVLAFQEQMLDFAAACVRAG